MLRPGATFEDTCARMGRDAEMTKLRRKFFVVRQAGGGPRKTSKRRAARPAKPKPKP
jgi:hypothetical protein